MYLSSMLVHMSTAESGLKHNCGKASAKSSLARLQSDHWYPCLVQWLSHFVAIIVMSVSLHLLYRSMALAFASGVLRMESTGPWDESIKGRN